MKISTCYDHERPAPMLWSALDADRYDGAPDAGPLMSAIGFGRTKPAAIMDLLDLIRDNSSESYNLGCDARNDFAARIPPTDLTWSETLEWLEGYDATNSGFETKSEEV